MDDFTFVKWMNEVLDPVKVRREESFQSPQHRSMVEAHELHKLLLEWENTRDHFNAMRLSELARWWAERDAQEKESETQRVEVKKRKDRVSKIRFTDDQLKIARAAFTREEK